MCERAGSSDVLSLGATAMAIARMPPGLARAVASLTLNRGFAPVVMAGLGPAVQVFLCSPIARRGWPAFGFIQGGAADGR